MAIKSTAILTTNTVLYTSDGDNALTTIIVCNRNTYDPNNPLVGSSTLKLYAVPNLTGNVASPIPENLIVNGLVIPAGETFTFDNEKMVLAHNDRIVAVASVVDTLVSTVSTLRI